MIGSIVTALKFVKKETGRIRVCASVFAQSFNVPAIAIMSAHAIKPSEGHQCVGPRGIQSGLANSSRVLPHSGSDEEQQGDSVEGGDPRLPFTCQPRRASSHVIEIPETLVAEQTVVIVRFKVIDNGVGLTPEGRARLFKPFSQVGMARVTS